MNKQPVIYYQTDPRWKNNDYSTLGEHTTIGASGCGPTAMAMVIATLKDKTVTPATECNWAKKHGYKAKNQGTYYGYFVPAGERYGLKVTRLNNNNIYGKANSNYHNKVLQAVKNGNYVIACMGPGNWTRSGHYVLLWDVIGDTAYINDPASSKQIRVRGSWSLFRSQVKYYWVVHNPKTDKNRKDEEDMTKQETLELINKTLDTRKQPVYNTINDVPDYAKETIQKLLTRGSLKGINGQNKLNLSEDMVRLLVIMDREELI